MTAGKWRSALKYRAICFDAFGTLLEITDKRNPYGELFRKLGCKTAEAKRLAMTINADAIDVLSALGQQLPPHEVLQEFCVDLEAEVKSVRLLPGCDEILRQLHLEGYRLWVISNLAPPYGAPLTETLKNIVDGFTLSYLDGVTKPNPAIYAKACERLGLTATEVLMVGDHPNNDVAGARAYGMGAARRLRG